MPTASQLSCGNLWARSLPSPIPAKPSSLETRQAQAKGQLKIVCLAKGANLKLDTAVLEWPRNSAASLRATGCSRESET